MSLLFFMILLLLLLTMLVGCCKVVWLGWTRASRLLFADNRLPLTSQAFDNEPHSLQEPEPESEPEPNLELWVRCNLATTGLRTRPSWVLVLFPDLRALPLCTRASSSSFSTWNPPQRLSLWTILGHSRRGRGQKRSVHPAWAAKREKS